MPVLGKLRSKSASAHVALSKQLSEISFHPFKRNVQGTALQICARAVEFHEIETEAF